MTSPCELVTERLATGDALTPDEQAHVARCVDCARMSSVPRLLAAAAAEPEPGPGFAARMTIGARGRLAARRRNRVAAGAFAAACAVAVGAVIVTRPDAGVTEPGAMRTLAEQEPTPRPPPVAERAATSAEEIVLDVVRVADVDTTLHGEASWSEITAPLVSYRALLAQQAARKGAPR